MEAKGLNTGDKVLLKVLTARLINILVPAMLRGSPVALSPDRVAFLLFATEFCRND